ncbi:methyltransferase-like protein 7A [Thalassophryne amazonica]|uniref:methyltransferase-like protein 7A n=1 Tax=Thalassophryne amazonica TaxID=390379 RepID=UPI001471040C|nr:methyltransferase-like protein 7A [Thalassophryne amazonica]
MTLMIKFFTLLVNILCLPLHLIYAAGLYSIYKRIFPFCVYRISMSYNKKMHDKKKELFNNLSEFKKPGGQLTILEVGCGTGANFEFFPSGSKVICVDPNPNFKYFLHKSASKFEHLTIDKFVVASGEDLRSIGDESVDVVVTTLVLCTVSDIPQTLREAHRVLKPGGSFYFLEHVVANPSSWTYFLQHVLQPAWYYFGDGCMLIRSTWKDLEAAGFSQLKLRHIEAPLNFLIKAHIIGYAVK